MNLTQIECLAKVVELGNYEHAAKALYMTPSAVAKNIKKVEGEFGVTLMIREGRRSFPSSQAVEIAEKASNVLRSFYALENYIRNSASENAARNPTSIVVSGSWMRSRCAGKEDFELFTRENSSYSFRCSERPNEACFAGLRSGAFDIAITLGERPIPGVSYHRIGLLEAKVKVSVSHRLAKKNRKFSFPI